MFHMSNDSDCFRTREELEQSGYRLEGNTFCAGNEKWLPLYEAKLFHQFDHRPGTFEGIPVADRFKMKAAVRETASQDLENPDYYPIPRYWVKQEHVEVITDAKYRWLLVYRAMTNVMTNSRNVVFSVIPLSAVGHSAPIAWLGETTSTVMFLCAANSLVFDYLTRQKLGGGNLTFFILKQIPIPGPDRLSLLFPPLGMPLAQWALARALELTYTAWDLEPFAQDCGWRLPPFRWDEGRRFLLRCELDAAFFHLYLTPMSSREWRIASRADGCPYDETPEELAALKCHFPAPRDAVAHIMDTFPIVRRKDEEKYGEYRTKRVILEIYDRMQAAIDSGRPYQTILDPPPADPRCCHPLRERGH